MSSVRICVCLLPPGAGGQSAGFTQCSGCTRHRHCHCIVYCKPHPLLCVVPHASLIQDSTGRRETAQVSASTREAKPTLPIADPTPPTPSQPPPQPPPAAEATQTAEATPPADPPPTEEEDKEKEAREQREMIQEYKTQKNIRSHVKDAYRTLQHADRVLLRYKVGPV